MINKLKISLLSIIFLVNIDLFSQVNVDAQGNRYKSGVSNIFNLLIIQLIYLPNC